MTHILNKLTPEEMHELNELCVIWNNLYELANPADDKMADDKFPLNRITELTTKGKFPVLLKMKDSLKIVGPWRM
jgi:hypothetical protein